MTKLFISYSRDDKAWVYELWRALRDRAHYDAWIDQRIVPAQDWWDSILTNVEDADCVIYVMSPKSVESIYCVAEVNYALALNKPVL
ncbi:MAG: toll/interleukin-1 receptor domain-containing protein, partial [Anaerolineae bacterium]|nr:toll/interleukin-1 receptor domain-containing protein [Anaerolineae bacterium]